MNSGATAAPGLVRIELGNPVTVAVSPPDVPVWGPYQFPRLSRLLDGRLLLTFHVEADSIASAGLPPARAVWDDEGRTWALLPREGAAEGAPSGGGVLLPNGDRLMAKTLRPRKAAELRLPERPFAQVVVNAKESRSIYRLEDLPPDCAAGWMVYRLPAGQTQWREEATTMRLPGETRAVADELEMMYFPGHFQLLVAPDGSLWSVNKGAFRVVDGRVQKKTPVFVLRSTDAGQTWDLWSEIPYSPDRAFDPQADERNGFSEPEVCFMPDGSALMLMRTTNPPPGIGPLYWSRSTDLGRTWSPPEVFDDLGVRPRLLTLQNGVTLAAYGRPGLYVRATADPAGLQWDRRITVIEPARKLGDETCSYTGLLALSDDVALLAYSEFDLHNPDGHRYKRIRVREVTAVPTGSTGP